MTLKTIAFATETQAAIFSTALVPELTKGHWANARFNGAQEQFAAAEVKVDPKAPGFVGDPAFTNFDLLNKQAVESMLSRAQKAKITKADGTTIDAPTLRRELRNMMFLMRTPKGKPIATSNQGKFGAGHKGRPSKELLAKLKGEAPVKATTKAKAKASTKGKGTKKAA